MEVKSIFIKMFYNSKLWYAVIGINIWKLQLYQIQSNTMSLSCRCCIWSANSSDLIIGRPIYKPQPRADRIQHINTKNGIMCLAFQNHILIILMPKSYKTSQNFPFTIHITSCKVVRFTVFSSLHFTINFSLVFISRSLFYSL